MKDNDKSTLMYSCASENKNGNYHPGSFDEILQYLV